MSSRGTSRLEVSGLLMGDPGEGCGLNGSRSPFHAANGLGDRSEGREVARRLGGGRLVSVWCQDCWELVFVLLTGVPAERAPSDVGLGTCVPPRRHCRA